MKYLWKLLSACSLVGLMSLAPVQAQREAGDVGIGLQLGQPSGLSLAVYNPNTMSLDILAAWDLGDFLYVNAHGIYYSHIGNNQNLHIFYGPGAFIGIRNKEGINESVDAGISGTLGLSIMIKKLEIYGRLTPRLQLIKETTGDVGGGLGIRYYF